MIVGALQGRTEEQVNLVNAPTMAQQRGIVFEEKVDLRGGGLQRADPRHGRRGRARAWLSPGTGIGPSRVPHLVEVQGRRLTIELERYVTVFRYQDLPGHDRPRRHGLRRARHQHLLGRGRPQPDGGGEGEEAALAAMVVTTDAARARAVVGEILASDGFVGGWAVDTA